MHHQHDEAARKVWNELEGRHACMLIDKDGDRLRARPMSPKAIGDEHAIWFITARDSAKDDEIRRDNQVCVTVSDETSNFYLSVSGRAQIIDDRAKLREIWTKYMEAFFPGGPDDPNAVLIKVTPEAAEYWDGPNAPVSYVKMLAAAVTGGKPDLGENRKVAM